MLAGRGGRVFAESRARGLPVFFRRERRQVRVCLRSRSIIVERRCLWLFSSSEGASLAMADTGQAAGAGEDRDSPKDGFPQGPSRVVERPSDLQAQQTESGGGGARGAEAAGASEVEVAGTASDAGAGQAPASVPAPGETGAGKVPFR